MPWGPGTPSPAANLMDPAYYSLYLARDSNTRFDNDLYAQRIDIERFLENPFFSSALFGFRSSQRSTERIRTQTTTDPFPGLSGTDLQRFLIPTPGDFFSFNSDGVYLDNFLTPNANQSAGLREELVRNAGLGANTQLAPPQGFSVDENTYIDSDLGADWCIGNDSDCSVGGCTCRGSVRGADCFTDGDSECSVNGYT